METAATAVEDADYVLGGNDELCRVDYQRLLRARAFGLYFVEG